MVSSISLTPADGLDTLRKKLISSGKETPILINVSENTIYYIFFLNHLPAKWVEFKTFPPTWKENVIGFSSCFHSIFVSTLQPPHLFLAYPIPSHIPGSTANPMSQSDFLPLLQPQEWHSIQKLWSWDYMQNILGWPKSSFKFFPKVVQKTPNELFGEPDIWPLIV